MDFIWYNNGERNKKIYEGQDPPKGYKKGYFIVKNKMERLKKLNKIYDRKIEALEKKTKLQLKLKKEKLEKELKEKQQIIFPDL